MEERAPYDAEPVALDRLEVRVAGESAATLLRTVAGVALRYVRLDRAVCWACPPRAADYHWTGDNLPPYFAGLLPEGLRLDALRHKLKTSASDMFSLAAAVGDEAVGDVSLHRVLLGVRERRGLYSSESFRDLRKRLLGIDTLDLESLLPGVQAKISSARLTLPLPDLKRGASVILKFGDDEHPRLAENEAHFMEWARKAGLSPARAELVRDSNGESGLLVHRFDRLVRRGLVVGSVHVEDACQFLDLYPSEKYRLPLRKVVEGAQELAASPAKTALDILRLHAYSWLIGNADLHAKNIALWRNPKTELIEVSPAYDLLCTLAYPKLDPHMALKMNGKDSGLTRKDFIDFGAVVGLPAKPVHKMLDQVLMAAEGAAATLDEIGWDDKTAEKVKRLLEDRRRLLCGA